MTGYIIDDLALIARLAGAGSERHRRELSRLLHGAIDAGPTLDVPALCLADATTTRPGLAKHLAEIIAAAPTGAALATATFPSRAKGARRAPLRGR